MAETLCLSYFPVGVGRACEPRNHFTGRDADYPDARDPSAARLVREQNHQQDDVRHDVPPMYRQ